MKPRAKISRPSLLPGALVELRETECRKCLTPCALARDEKARTESCARCPLSAPRWHEWGRCESIAPAQVVSARTSAPPETSWSILRRIRSYRRAGFLIGLLQFLQRRDACRHCDRARTLPTHPGLYGCGSCSTCTGGPERILQPHSTCPRNLWPSPIPIQPTPQTAPS
jgi:hypothetical protein